MLLFVLLMILVPLSLVAGGGAQTVLMVLAVGGIAAALATVLAAGWALLRLACQHRLDPDATRHLGARLAAGMAQGGDVLPALRAARAEVRWPFSRRLGLVVRDLESPLPPTVVDAMARHRLLPAPLVRTARAAEQAGLLHGWCARLGHPAIIPAPSLAWPLALALAASLICVAVIQFIQTYLEPRFIQMLQELQIQDIAREMPGPGLRLALTMLPMLALLVLGLALVFLERRHLVATAMANLLLEGIRAGRPEAELAQALAVAMPARAAALRAAGTAGDLPALMRAAGWPVGTAGALQAAISRTEARRIRWILWWEAVGTRLLPLVVGIPVLITVLSVWRSLMAILYAV